MAQNGRTKRGPFHGKMDRSRESQGWTTACSSMSERRTKEKIAQSKRARAGSLAIVDKPQVARTCIPRADIVLSFSGVTFVLFRFSFSSFLPLSKQWPFVQSFNRSVVPRYACALAATRSYL